MEESREIKTILWPNDLSKCSEEALPYVRSLAKKYGARVHVLYVVEDLTDHESWYGDFDPSHAGKIMRWEQKKAAERQQELCQQYLADCAEYQKHITTGNPVLEILKFIDAEKVDMVVMCKKGKTGSFDIGGVAQKIISSSPVPVVVTSDTPVSPELP